MVSTSGTVGSTTIQVVDMLEDAMKACGLSTGEMTPENWVTARNNLYFYLSALANDGLQLWTLQKFIIGMYPGQTTYALDQGAVDVWNAVYRTVNAPGGGTPASSAGGIAANAFDNNVATFCTQVTPNGNISYDFGAGVTSSPVMFGILPNGTATYNLVYERSADGITWVQEYAAGSQTYTDAIWTLNDTSSPVTAARFWRVRETGGSTLNVAEVMFGANPYDISIARMSNDVYANLTNKYQTGQSQYPLQYWVDRQVNGPLLHVWPAPTNAQVQIVAYRRRHIQDVGQLTNILEIPQRWITAVTYALADLMILKLDVPDKKRQEIFMRVPLLQARAQAEYIRASMEERDDTQVDIMSGMLTPYTGG